MLKTIKRIIKLRLQLDKELNTLNKMLKKAHSSTRWRKCKTGIESYNIKRGQ